MTPEEKRWWNRLSGTILQVGAVATALTAVVGLVVLVWPDSETPPKLGAELSNVQVREGVTLAEFSARHEDAAAPGDLSPRYELAEAAPPIAQATSPEGADGDGDGKPDALDECPRQYAQTDDGCPTTGDRDRDGKPDADDACPEQAAPEADDGCPTTEGDRDKDGKPDPLDKCPSQAGHLQNGCPLHLRRDLGALVAKIDEFQVGDSGCTAEEPEPGVRRVSCPLTIVPTGGDAKARARAILEALHGTRTVDGPGNQREPLGVEVSFHVDIEGYAGRRADVRWSLYHERGRRLPHEWLRDRRVLDLKGEAIKDGADGDFWVPLPKHPRGPYHVKVAVHGDHGTRLTSKDTPPFG